MNYCARIHFKIIGSFDNLSLIEILPVRKENIALKWWNVLEIMESLYNLKDIVEWTMRNDGVF